MEKNIPSEHNESCTHCGEKLASWATEIGHCHICMHPLPESDPALDDDSPTTSSTTSRDVDTPQPAPEQRLPTAEELVTPSTQPNHNNDMDDVDDLDSDEDDLPEDTMRYTKSNSRVLLQEDTHASTHLGTSPALEALDTTQEQMPQEPESAYDPHQHLPTEEANFHDLLEHTDSADHQQTTVTTPFNNLAKTQIDILDDEPTMRIVKPKEITSKETTPKETTPDEAPNTEEQDRPASQFKQVRGILGVEKPPPPLSPYMLEEQHTLSQPLDVVAELRKRSEEPAPHLAASFALSQTLQDLSLKEVQELRPKASGPKPNPEHTLSPETSDPPAPDPAQADAAAPPTARFPTWLLWFLGGLLWVGLGALLWNFVVAPAQDTERPPAKPTITRLTEPPQEARQGTPTPDQTNPQPEQAQPDTSPIQDTQETQRAPDIQEEPSIRKKSRKKSRRNRRRNQRRRKRRRKRRALKRKQQKSKNNPTERPTKRPIDRPTDRPTE